MSKINLFTQIISKLDRNSFKFLVKEKQPDKHQKGFDSWSHLASILFAEGECYIISLLKANLYEILAMDYALPQAILII